MAEPEDDEEKAGPHRKKDAQRQRILIGVGIASLIVILIMLRKTSSSNNPNQAQALQDAQNQLAAQEAAMSQYGIGAGYGGYSSPGSYSPQYAGMSADPYAQQMMADLQAIQMSIANESATGNAGTAIPSAPSGPVANPLSGWTKILNYSAFESYKSSGKTIDFLPAGEPTSAPLVPFFSGGKQVGPSPGAGSTWYVKS